MFSVLIVDDEEPVLESFEFMLNSFCEDGLPDESLAIKDGAEREQRKKINPFKLAGKARTGYEAIKLIHETEPNVVFMDINIPTIDGLTVLEDVHKKYPRMIIILSTAYERFDMARRAIPLGVFAYLVKPVSSDTFYSTMEKALIRLRSMTHESYEYSESHILLLRRDVWTAMDEQRWSWFRKTLVLPSDHGIALMVEIERDMEIMAKRIAEQLSYKHHCVFDVMLNRGLFLVCEEITPDIFRQKSIKLLEKLLGNTKWNFGIGGCYRGPELYRSCNEALAELTSKQRKTDAWNNVSDKIATLRKKIGLAAPEETRSLFTAIWEPLFSEDFSAAKRRMISLFTLLLDDLYHCWSFDNNFGGSSPALPSEISIDPAEIMDLPDLDAWKRWAERNFDKLALHASIERQGKYPPPLAKALAFVQNNYTQLIQLSDVAEAAQVNATYLSRLFTEHLKTNFVDYLTNLRVNEAERLLKEKSISVKEAAFASGYQDPNYFTKIFKKIKGILPTEAGQK